MYKVKCEDNCFSPMFLRKQDAVACKKLLEPVFPNVKFRVVQEGIKGKQTIGTSEKKIKGKDNGNEYV